MRNDTLTGRSPGNRGWRIAAYIVAFSLIVFALGYAIQDQRGLNWTVLLEADPWFLFGVFAAVTASGIVVPGFQFWLVTRPFVTGQSLGIPTMQALIASSGLLNYTPVKAGLFGRVAYLRQIHGVGLKAAVLTHALIAAQFVAVSLLTVLLILWRKHFDFLWWIAVIIGIVFIAVTGAPILKVVLNLGITVEQRLRDSYASLIVYLLVCTIAQFVGLFCTAFRWWLVFKVLDHPVSFAHAWMTAITHIFAVMAGPANGLGLREWLIGLGGGYGWFLADPEADIGIGVAVALADRAVEATVFIIFGLLGLFFLRQKLRAISAGRIGS